MIQVSSELVSQHISKNAIADLLYYLNRANWQQKYNRHQIDIEPWYVGIWVKQAGIISYKDLAGFIRETTKLKASGLIVERKSHNLFLVQGSQQSQYTVMRQNGHYVCECMLYRCRNNRLRKELPQLFNALNKKIFCHHSVAAWMHVKAERL